MSQQYSVRKYQEGDETQILELRELVFHSGGNKGGSQEQWLAWWRWMFMDNPAGKGIIWLAIDKDRVIGHYASVPIRVKIGEEVVVCGMSVDSMIHPDYQRKGIFITLARKAYEEAASRGIYVLYGLPNRAAFKARIKNLNWVDAGRLRNLIKVLNLEHLLSEYFKCKPLARPVAIIGGFIINLFLRSRKIPDSDGLIFTRVYSFDERIDDFWKKVFKQPKIMIVRDKAFMEWKYLKSPGINYTIYLAEKYGQIYGYVISRCIKRRGLKFGIIYDIVAFEDNPDIIRGLVSKAVACLKQEYADLVLGKMIANNTYINAFCKNGFFGLGFIIKSRFHIYSDHPAIRAIDINKPEQWFLQIGDTEQLTGPLDQI